MASDSTAQLMKSLTTDRFIKIFVADNTTTPYLVPQSALEHASEYFAKAIKNEHMGEGNVGVLRFPEDDKNAWQLILHWIVRHDLPPIADTGSTSHQSLLIHCWVLADKYFMPRLQNFVMIKLLDIFDGHCTIWDSVTLAFSLTCGRSVLRKLFAQEMLYAFDANSSPMSRKDTAQIDELGRIGGAMSDVLQAQESQPINQYESDRLLSDCCDCVAANNYPWLQFMVGSPKPGDDTYRRREQVLHDREAKA